jgi:spermidine synthase
MMMIDGNAARWLCEPIQHDVMDQWRLDEVLHESRTKYQEVLIARTRLGVTLFCDDNPQSAETGQLAFHEAELVPAMLLATRPVQRVLVIGCSEGTVSQIAVQSGAELVDHVDIDQDCVWACARYLPYGFDADEVRQAETGEATIRLHYADGRQFVLDALRSGRRYDIVVLDLPEEREDIDAQQNVFYGREFLECCRELLVPGGVLSTHVSRPYLSVPTPESRESFVRPWRRFGQVFGTRVYFRSAEQPWAAIMLGQREPEANPVRWMVRQLASLPYWPRTIDAPMLISATHLPRALRAAVG